MNKDLVLNLIENYIRHLKMPSECWNGEKFRQASYASWAAVEFYKYICRIECLEWSDLEWYVDLMNDLSCKNINTSYVFSVAKDISEDILDYVVSNYERRNHEK